MKMFCYSSLILLSQQNRTVLEIFNYVGTFVCVTVHRVRSLPGIMVSTSNVSQNWVFLWVMVDSISKRFLCLTKHTTTPTRSENFGLSFYTGSRFKGFPRIKS